MRLISVVGLCLCLVACIHRPYGPGLDDSLVRKADCSPSVVQREWALHAWQPVGTGDSLCTVLGRYGWPMTNRIMSVGTMNLWSMTWIHNSNVYTVSLASYFDSTTAQQLHVPVGQWVVRTFSFSQ